MSAALLYSAVFGDTSPADASLEKADAGFAASTTRVGLIGDGAHALVRNAPNSITPKEQFRFREEL